MREDPKGEARRWLPGEVPSHYYDDPQEAEKALSWSEKVIKLVSNFRRIK